MVVTIDYFPVPFFLTGYLQVRFFFDIVILNVRFQLEFALMRKLQSCCVSTEGFNMTPVETSEWEVSGICSRCCSVFPIGFLILRRLHIIFSLNFGIKNFLSRLKIRLWTRKSMSAWHDFINVSEETENFESRGLPKSVLQMLQQFFAEN